MNMRIKTKNTFMYSGVAVCVIGMLSGFLIPVCPMWAAAIVMSAGAAVAFVSAFSASRHVYKDEADQADARQESAYQSMAMASGMCFGAAISFLVTDNVSVGMPVGMIAGFLVGSLTKKK